MSSDHPRAVCATVLPGREVTVEYGDYTLRLFVDMGVGIGGDKWPAADLFCKFITCPPWQPFFDCLLLQRRVLELGSGSGLGGILADTAFNCAAVTVTDEGSHMKHIQANIKRNDCSVRCEAVELDWFCPESSLLFNREQYDVIFALEW